MQGRKKMREKRGRERGVEGERGRRKGREREGVGREREGERTDE